MVSRACFQTKLIASLILLQWKTREVKHGYGPHVRINPPLPNLPLAVSGKVDSG